MLDIQFIRANAELVAEKARQKGYAVDIDKLLGLDNDRRELQQQVDALRQRRNENADHIKTAGGQPSQDLIDKGKVIKVELAEREELLGKTEVEWLGLLKQVPNIALDDVPVGESEQQNVVAKTVGERPHMEFEPKPHWELMFASDWLDQERAVRLSGSRFVYLKGGVVRLQFALVQFVLDMLGNQEVIRKLINENNLQISDKPFTPVLPPVMLRTEPYEASARLNAEEVTYKLADDDLWLNASAEHTLCTMYWNEIVPAEQLPIRYIGYSPSFRREAGTYGKDTEGIIRLHQFDKLEMEVFSTPETGLDEHKLLIAVQEYLVQQLGLQYNFIQKCTADIGKPNARGIDIDCWFPGQDRYIETHTADYMTDYQARDLNTRFKRGEATEPVHTNDATAFALGRIMAAIVENYQQADGSVRVPNALRAYMNNQETI